MTKLALSDAAVMAQRSRLSQAFYEQLLARVLRPLGVASDVARDDF